VSYRKLLRDNDFFQGMAEKYDDGPLSFEQDSAPAHRAKACVK
jgi:hypothetical protein